LKNAKVKITFASTSLSLHRAFCFAFFNFQWLVANHNINFKILPYEASWFSSLVWAVSWIQIGMSYDLGSVG